MLLHDTALLDGDTRHEAAPPTVSICMPTYNGARYLGAALRSAVGQTWEDLEILVVDGGSTDQTVSIARSMVDARVRVVDTGRDDGMVANWNRTVRMARGRYIKFLFQDDTLAETCVERMVRVLEDEPRVGLVFSPRSIAVEDPDDPLAQEWMRYNQDVHLPLGRLTQRIPGRSILIEHVEAGLKANFIGEPTCVMVRRECFAAVGLFNPHMRQLVDLDMWLRILSSFDAGFVDERLATFRIHRSTATSAHMLEGRGWLDRLWLIESVVAAPAITPRDRARIGRLRWRAIAGIMRMEARRLRRGRAPSIKTDGRSLRDYLAYRREVARGRAPALYETL